MTDPDRNAFRSQSICLGRPGRVGSLDLVTPVPKHAGERAHPGAADADQEERLVAVQLGTVRKRFPDLSRIPHFRFVELVASPSWRCVSEASSLCFHGPHPRLYSLT